MSLWWSGLGFFAAEALEKAALLASFCTLCGYGDRVGLRLFFPRVNTRVVSWIVPRVVY